VLSLLKARPTRPLEEVSATKDRETAVGRPMACPCYFPLACVWIGVARSLPEFRAGRVPGLERALKVHGDSQKTTSTQHPITSCEGDESLTVTVAPPMSTVSVPTLPIAKEPSP
jgi:hypothetical protein